MRCRVYVTVWFRVRLSHRSTAALAAAGEFAVERPAGRRYRSTAAGAGAQQQMPQRHVDSRRKRLNTGWSLLNRIKSTQFCEVAYFRNDDNNTFLSESSSR